jgi:hypothetical protein
MKRKLLFISIPTLLILFLGGVLFFDYSEQKREARHLMTRATLLDEQFSQIGNIPSGSVCGSERLRLTDNYLSLSRDVSTLDERWISSEKLILEDLVSRIRGFAQELSAKCAK